jgi:hypothetical protein
MDPVLAVGVLVIDEGANTQGEHARGLGLDSAALLNYRTPGPLTIFAVA